MLATNCSVSLEQLNSTLKDFSFLLKGNWEERGQGRKKEKTGTKSKEEENEENYAWIEKRKLDMKNPKNNRDRLETGRSQRSGPI